MKKLYFDALPLWRVMMAKVKSNPQIAHLVTDKQGNIFAFRHVQTLGNSVDIYEVSDGKLITFRVACPVGAEADVAFPFEYYNAEEKRWVILAIFDFDKANGLSMLQEEAQSTLAYYASILLTELARRTEGLI